MQVQLTDGINCTDITTDNVIIQLSEQSHIQQSDFSLSHILLHRMKSTALVYLVLFRVFPF